MIKSYLAVPSRNEKRIYITQQIKGFGIFRMSEPRESLWFTVYKCRPVARSENFYNTMGSDTFKSRIHIFMQLQFHDIFLQFSYCPIVSMNTKIYRENE